jgi:hypothetical protein
VARQDWATFVGIEPAEEPRLGARRSRRLLAVAGVTFAVSGLTVTTMVIIGLGLEGAH